MLVVEQASFDQQMCVHLQSGGSVMELPLEEYLIGVVLCEMPPSFELEALKAQAIAARTFALRQMDGGKHSGYDLCSLSSCCQAWSTKDDLIEKLGNSWERYWEKATLAVAETESLVLFHEDMLIDAVYFSCSGGQTEDAVAVWGSEVPYLQSVKSPGEEMAGKFHSEKVVSVEEFCRVISDHMPLVDLKGSPDHWFGEVAYTNGGGVKEMIIGGYAFSGTQLRQMFGLNSTNFSVETSEDEILFSVYGYGHRVGMSQYGANAMAAEGYSCDEILRHYYQNVRVKKWK